MELQHTFTVPAPVDRAWSTLLDVEGIAPCFPGATLTGVDGDGFSGTVKVKLGPVSLQYSGKGRFLQRDEAARLVVLEANGTDKRGNGTAGATVHARLEPTGDNETRVVVDTDLKVTGRPAQFGRGVLQDVGGRIIDQFAGCLATRMGAPSEPGDAADAGDAGAGDGGEAGDLAPAEEPTAATAASARAETGVTFTSESGAAVPPPSGTAPTETAPTETAPTETAPTETTPSALPTLTSAGTAGVPTGTQAPRRSAPAPTPAPRAPAPAPAAELDLNAVVLPALARRYGPALLAVLLVLIVVRVILRRRA